MVHKHVKLILQVVAQTLEGIVTIFVNTFGPHNEEHMTEIFWDYLFHLNKSVSCIYWLMLQ